MINGSHWLNLRFDKLWMTSFIRVWLFSHFTPVHPPLCIVTLVTPGDDERWPTSKQLLWRRSNIILLVARITNTIFLNLINAHGRVGGTESLTDSNNSVNSITQFCSFSNCCSCRDNTAFCKISWCCRANRGKMVPTNIASAGTSKHFSPLNCSTAALHWACCFVSAWLASVSWETWLVLSWQLVCRFCFITVRI